MNVLAQVAALFRVSFIGPREPFERRSEFIDRFPVLAILIRLAGRDEFSSHTQGSRRGGRFLTDLTQKNKRKERRRSVARPQCSPARLGVFLVVVVVRTEQDQAGSAPDHQRDEDETRRADRPPVLEFRGYEV